MKNFPDKDNSKELEKRLQDYSEQPDDLVWSNVDKALRDNRTPNWTGWIDRLTSITSIILLGVMLQVHSNSRGDLSSVAQAPDLQHSSPKQQKVLLELTPKVKRPAATPPEKRNGSSDFSFSENKKVRFSNTAKDGVNRNTSEAIDTLHSQSRIEPNAMKQNIEAVTQKQTTTDSIYVASSVTNKDSLLVEKEITPSTIKKLLKKGLSFYVSVTPQFSFQQVTPLGQDGVIITKLYNQPILSSDRLGVQIEFGLQGRVTKRWDYYGGFSIVRQRQTIKYGYQSNNRVNLESTNDLNYAVTPEVRIGVINYEMLNLGASAGILYHLSGDILAHKIGGGLSYQQGFKKSSSEQYDNAQSQYLFYQVFYRNELKLSARLRLFVQPSFSQSLFTSEKLNAPFSLKPYRAGLGFGLLYQF